MVKSSNSLQPSSKNTDTVERMWTVFLVDDDPGDLYLTERVVKNSPYVGTTVCVPSGKALFSELRARHFFYDQVGNPPCCLILLDIHMPDEDGISLLNQLKNNPYTENIPIVMLTGDCHTNNIERTYYLHADSYLLKPMNDDHLGHINSILKRAQH